MKLCLRDIESQQIKNKIIIANSMLQSNVFSTNMGTPLGGFGYFDICSTDNLVFQFDTWYDAVYSRYTIFLYIYIGIVKILDFFEHSRIFNIYVQKQSKNCS